MLDSRTPDTPDIKLFLFGPVDVRRTRGPTTPSAPLQPKRAAMLAWLAMAQSTGRRNRGAFHALFWPELDDARARRALNQALHYLRQELGDGVIESRGADQVALSDRVWCDTLAFEAALDAGRLEEAMLLYRGDFLEGLRTGDLVEFERWADDQRARLRARASGAAWSLADQAAPHDAAASLAWAQRATDLGPELDEPSIRRLIATHDRCGDRAGAIRVFAQYAERLQREFDTEPDPETLTLLRTVRARVSQHSSPALGVPRIPPSGEIDAIGVRSELPDQLLWRKQSRRAPSGSRMQRVIMFSTVAIVLVVVAGAWSLLRPGPPDTGTVAVFPFAYSGPAEQSHLAAAVAALVAADLDGTAGLKSIDPAAVANAVRGESMPLTRMRAEEIARGFGAAAFVMGEVAQVGKRVRVLASLHATEGWRSSTQSSADGTPAELFPLVDGLTGRLLAHSDGDDDPRGAATRRAAAKTTTSLPALKAFLAAEGDIRAGRFATAAGTYRRAIMYDSTFVLAYLRLSIATNWIGANAESQWAADRAMQYRARLGPHERRHVEAWHLYTTGEVLEARRLYRAIVAVDSADIEAWLRLGEIAYHWGPMLGETTGASRAEWSRVLSLDERNASAIAHLARIAAREGRTEDFAMLARRLEQLDPDPDQRAELGILRSFAFGSDADRAAAIAPLVRLDPRVRADFVGEAAAIAPARQQTAELLMSALGAGRNVTDWEGGHLVLHASAYMARGQRARANAVLDTAMSREKSRVTEYRAALAIGGVPGYAAELPRLLKELEVMSGPGLEHPLTMPWRLYLRGAGSVRLGNVEQARAIILRMRDPRLTSTNKDVAGFMVHYARQLEAELLAREGKAAAALVLLGPPELEPDLRRPRIWAQPRVHERLLRARLLEAVGRRREALAWYEGFPDPSAYDLAYLPLALANRARILRALGESAAAAGVDRQLATLIADADAGYRATSPAPSVSAAQR